MLSKRINDEWKDHFFIEAEKWSDLVYAHSRILELLRSERYQNVNGIKEQLLTHIQEGLLGNIEVIESTKMKQECTEYYEISYKNHKKYCEKNKDINPDFYKEEAENFKKVRKLIEKLDGISEESKVIRFNILGNQISKVYDAEFKKVIQKNTKQEMASYIFVVRDEIYVVDVDDPW